MLRALALCFAFFALLSGVTPGAAGADPALQRTDGPELPAHVVADPNAPEVTRANLLENERFWPYRVALVEPWRPVPQEAPLPIEIDGVLIRIEPSGLARIDFGRGGVQRVPVEKTDLLARANRLRLGQDEKSMPNLALQIAPRLIAVDGERAAAHPLVESIEMRGYLCVFADPAAPGFAELVKALAPLAEHPGTLSVLFAQGEHPDAALREQLRTLGWKGVFMTDFLSEPYTGTLVDAGTPIPRVQLQTNEGRIVLEEAWKPGLERKLGLALREAFPTRAQASASSTAPAATP